MDKAIREDFKILQNIIKNASNKRHDCLVCSEKSINSHVLQKNGILNLISSNNHIKQVKSKGFFAADENGILDIQSVGINNAMSYPLFCNLHDTDIFAPIEKKELNLDNYYNKLLFSYRALCAEVRKKMINLDTFERILNSSHFSTKDSLLNLVRNQIEGNKIGIKDMTWYKENFEQEIEKIESRTNFVFEKIDFDLIPVSVSAVYSPIDTSIHNSEFFKNKENILNYIFINLIPQADKLSLIIGYHLEKNNPWITNYIKSWKNLTKKEFEIKLTDLFATKIETWAISPEYFSKLKPENVKAFKKYWNEHAMDLRVNQEVDFNLFE